MVVQRGASGIIKHPRYYRIKYKDTIVVYTGLHQFQPPVLRWIMPISSSLGGWKGYHNRLLKMPDHRLPKVVCNWDVHNGGKCWVKEVDEIVRTLHLPPVSAGIQYDLTAVEGAIKAYDRNLKWEEVETKPKLHYYKNFKDMSW